MVTRPVKMSDSKVAADSDLEIDGERSKSEQPAKNQAAVELGRLGGRKGGPARAAKLTSEQRSTIARNAAASRWKFKQDEASEMLPVFPPAKKAHIGA